MSSTSLNELAIELRDQFPHPPTKGQERLITAFSRFLFSDKKSCTLIVKGYAGTGKTTSIGAIVRSSWRGERGSERGVSRSCVDARSGDRRNRAALLLDFVSARRRLSGVSARSWDEQTARRGGRPRPPRSPPGGLFYIFGRF